MGQIKVILGKTLLLLMVSILSSCMVMRPGASKSGKHLYESFFISLNANQYFIKPMEFKSEEGLELWVDFTFRDKDESGDSATVNFTLRFDQIVKSVDSIKIENGKEQCRLEDISYIYTAKKKEKYDSRFTSRSSNPSRNQLFSYNEWNINVFFGNQDYTFSPTKRTARNIDNLEENVISIIRE